MALQRALQNRTVVLVLAIVAILSALILHFKAQPEGAGGWAFGILAVTGIVGLSLAGLSPRTGGDAGPGGGRGLMGFDKSTFSRDANSLSAAMTELANGDLTVKLEVHSREVSETEDPWFNETVGYLNMMIGVLDKTADEFNRLTDIHCRRLCYVGAESFLEGRKCGEAMVERLKGHGKVQVVTGSFAGAGLELRRKGFESFLFENAPGIEILPAVETLEDMDRAYKVSSEVLRKHPDLVGIYVTEGSSPPAVARAVIESGRRDIKIVGHDLTDETMRYVKDGVISVTLGQDPFAQGFDPVVHLYNHIVAHWMPPTPRLLTRMDLVTSENYQEYWQEGVGLIESADSADRLAKPVDKKPTKQLRIGVLGCENSPFWMPVKDGALKAGELLRRSNTTVEWILPQGDGLNKDLSGEVYGPLLDELVEKRYDGIVVVSVDKDLIPHINRAVQAGIPVTVANSEPISLRSLIQTIHDQSDELLKQSSDLDSSAGMVRQATDQIGSAMTQVARGAQEQNDQVSSTQQSLAKLVSDIGQVRDEASASANAAKQTGGSLQRGTDVLNTALGNIGEIAGSVKQTWDIVSVLEGHSARIIDIVKLIKGIATQVNLLALNASVEAARAGEAGKGFSVVAEEIRRLAVNTAGATEEVGQVVDSIMGDVTKLSDLISKDSEKIDGLTQLTDEVKNAFGTIRVSVQEDQQRLNHIADAIGEMAHLSEDLGVSMERVAEVSVKNAAAAEEVSSSTETMVAEIHYVTQLAHQFGEMARGQMDMLAKFKL
jgi:methyl-accepting chemotaxis protein